MSQCHHLGGGSGKKHLCILNGNRPRGRGRDTPPQPQLALIGRLRSRLILDKVVHIPRGGLCLSCRGLKHLSAHTVEDHLPPGWGRVNLSGFLSSTRSWQYIQVESIQLEPGRKSRSKKIYPLCPTWAQNLEFLGFVSETPVLWGSRLTFAVKTNTLGYFGGTGLPVGSLTELQPEYLRAPCCLM